MDFGNNGFEELEPRATPQPTLLKCMTDPSVPEVSLIFGKQQPTTQSSSTNRNISEEKCRAYANWRTVEYPSTMDSRSVTHETMNGQYNSASPRPRNGMPSNPSNFYAESIERNNSANLSSNSSPMHNNREHPSPVQKHCSVAVPRDVDGRSVYRYEQQFQDETGAFASPRKQLVEAPVQNGCYNAVRSILKSSLLNTAVTRPSSDGGVRSDSDFRNKSPSRSNHHHHHYKTRRHTDSSMYSPASPVSRCQHKVEHSHESDTVRDLLLLVKNQNEQIKSLQTQVERLLEIHEHNIGYLDNRRSIVAKSSEKSESPTHTHDTENLLKNNVLMSAQRACHSRGIGAVPSLPSDEQSEVSTRYQSDAMRNTIMEKKVSIGVMTSFEFSVQNNPFVSDTDKPSNGGALRDCGNNASTSGDTWNPRNAATGPLDKISEDTESYPSSIWRQSSNNTQLSSSDKYASRLTPYGNDNRGYVVEGVSELSPNSRARQVRNNGNDSPVAFQNEASNPSAVIGNLRSYNDRAPELSNKIIEGVSNPEICSPNNRLERNENILQRQSSRNDYNRIAAIESSNDCKKSERGIHRYSERTSSERRSIPAENTADGSFVLCSSDVAVPDRSLISLDPSIHVEMREYSSDDENEEAKRTPAVGWTFYKNVVGQVNRILHSIPGGQDIDENEKINPIAFHNDIAEKKDILNSVKSATLEQLKMLGISYAEHSQFNGEHTQKKVTFDSSYRPSVDYQTQNMTQQPSNSMTETNTSMHMKTLALKYLSDEQLADLAVHKQGVGAAMKHKFLSVQGTNMSFATMNYLQRYCLVSGMQTVNGDGIGHGGAARQKKHLPMTNEPQSPARNHSSENSVHKGARDNILDITTLKQQPKLL